MGEGITPRTLDEKYAKLAASRGSDVKSRIRETCGLNI